MHILITEHFITFTVIVSNSNSYGLSLNSRWNSTVVELELDPAIIIEYSL